ncbi:MAG TPA: DUF3459 domain-containing protein, partial [Isosphaeraceae bacterium]
FLYFTDHEEDLGRLVTEGRRREFRHFLAFVDPDARERIPDPQDPATFAMSRLDWDERSREPHASIVRLHQALLALRRAEPALRSNRRDDYEAAALDDATVLLVRNGPAGAALLLVARLRGEGIADLGGAPDLLPPAGGRWDVVLTTEDPEFAPDPAPPQVALDGPAPVIRFARPSAVLLRVTWDGPSQAS